jgi:chitin disaccharide deacetylase
MTRGKYLIVNADDFGQSAGINRGIIESFENGIVTSASLMVRWPAALEAARYSREHPDLSVGLHIDLGEWAFRGGSWMHLYEVVPTEDREAAVDEIAHQLATFRKLTRKEPTHMDSHQHVHRSEPVRSILIEVAREVGVPLRDLSPEVQYCGAFYGQTQEGEPLLNSISSDALTEIFSDLPNGVTELGCHPAKQIDLYTTYGTERLEELTVLCDEQVWESIERMNIELCSFHDLTRLGKR